MELVSIPRVRKKTLKLVSEVNKKNYVRISTLAGSHAYKELRGDGLYIQ